jgi:hypothetical protein
MLEEEAMRVVLSAAIILAGVTASGAQDASVPDLKGVWSGMWKTIIYGTNEHHPGTETAASPPRVRDIAFTMEFEGQDGRVLWGHSWSDPAEKEPFAAMISGDGKSIHGVDTDGSFDIAIVSATAMNACYRHAGLGPSGSIVASCGEIVRSD